MIEQNSENVKCDALRAAAEKVLATFDWQDEVTSPLTNAELGALHALSNVLDGNARFMAMALAVNAHAALEARVAALEDMLQEIEDAYSETPTGFEFQERYMVLGPRVRALLQEGL